MRWDIQWIAICGTNEIRTRRQKWHIQTALPHGQDNSDGTGIISTPQQSGCIQTDTPSDFTGEVHATTNRMAVNVKEFFFSSYACKLTPCIFIQSNSISSLCSSSNCFTFFFFFFSSVAFPVSGIHYCSYVCCNSLSHYTYSYFCSMIHRNRIWRSHALI